MRGSVGKHRGYLLVCARLPQFVQQSACQWLIDGIGGGAVGQYSGLLVCACLPQAI